MNGYYMQYMGGKGRKAKYIVPAILEATDRRARLIEPFIGGASITELIAPHFQEVQAGDLSRDIVLYWQAMQSGWVPPDRLTRDEYNALRHAEPSALRAFAGFGCSFGGKWFGGYGWQQTDARHPHGHVSVGSAKTSRRKIRAMGNVTFVCQDYRAWQPGPGDVVYADPPYAGTTAYGGLPAWDAEQFWQTMAQWECNGAHVFVSEYAAPAGWSSVWSQDVKVPLRQESNLSVATECLFTSEQFIHSVQCNRVTHA